MPPIPRAAGGASNTANKCIVLKDVPENVTGERTAAGSHAINTGRRKYHYPTAQEYDLQLGQIRVLGLLLAAKRRGECTSRQRIKVELGISPLSGTLGTWFEGIRKAGTKRGRPRKGLFDHGMVTEEALDVEGIKELVLELTPLGVEVAEALETERGDIPLPPLRSAEQCTNQRYLVD